MSSRIVRKAPNQPPPGVSTNLAVLLALACVDPTASGRLIGSYMVYYAIGTGGGAIAATSAYGAWGWGAVCVLGAGLSALALLIWVVDRIFSREVPGAAPPPTRTPTCPAGVRAPADHAHRVNEIPAFWNALGAGPESDTTAQASYGVCGLPAASTSTVFCQGHRPVISSSSEKLRKVRMATIKASTPTLAYVGATATVRMMSPATRSSSPRRIDRPRRRR
jgi:hypothetical protein